MRFTALHAAVAAAPLLLPLPASAGAFFTFSGTVALGEAENSFGVVGPAILDGATFTGTLRVGGTLASFDNFLAGFDDTLLTFTAATLSITINGVTESATVFADPNQGPFTLDVYNGINPRFGLDSTGFDDLYINLLGASATAFAALRLEIEADEEAVPGGAPGVPFSVTTNTTTAATINGLVLAAAISAAGDFAGFEIAALEFTLSLVSVPVPGAAALLGAGLLGLAGASRLRRAG